MYLKKVYHCLADLRWYYQWSHPDYSSYAQCSGARLVRWSLL